jgi:AraC family transcriptional regulator of adaptative response/methylated-DNA-[protein]-cysteine methyltransferase
MLAHDEDSLYRALLARDPAYDGLYFVGVSSTGIYCRLTCPARKPRRENVRFFDASAAAREAGFRACRRCRPDEPLGDVPGFVRALVDGDTARRWTEADLRTLGHDPDTLRRAFRRHYGTTFAQYARERRLANGVARLQRGGTVLEAQLDAGYESDSGFRAAVANLLGDGRPVGRDALVARWFETPIGAMLGVAGDDGVHLLEFAERRGLPRELERLRARRGVACFGEHSLLERLDEELQRHFGGASGRIDVPLAPQGTPFEREVWAALRAIPCGTTASYAEVATAIGRPSAVRAVARANGANTVAIAVPCHRVIGADGALTGYGGKLWRKEWLLEHERRRACRASAAGESAAWSRRPG